MILTYNNIDVKQEDCLKVATKIATGTAVWSFLLSWGPFHVYGMPVFVPLSFGALWGGIMWMICVNNIYPEIVEEETDTTDTTDYELMESRPVRDIVYIKESGSAVGKVVDLPRDIDTEQIEDLAAAIIRDGKPFSRSAVVPDILSRSQLQRLQQSLIKAGYCEKNADNSISFTDHGYAWIGEYYA